MKGSFASEWQGRLLVVTLKEGFGGWIGFGHAVLSNEGGTAEERKEQAKA